ncbi:uncharacterized protein LOC115408246 isoform X2 [Salarias fasciatus]|uniref:uncharacterized protein LOC115408246 isoform X2 n=1 Tax=Salarias fasciatus TaxID=181472 RepID=UPI0011767FA6|nr:uncharacterized protein LOC115408246 isoform X2 [Salarias fasciatus]
MTSNASSTCDLVAPHSPVQQVLPGMHSPSLTDGGHGNATDHSEEIVEEGSNVEPMQSFQVSAIIEESSIRDPEVPAVLEDREEVEEVEYCIIDSSSQRGKRKLVDNRGYQYTVKRARGTATDWRCCVRNKTVVCRATVVQRGDTFAEGPHAHVHGAVPGLKTAAQVRANVRQKAVQDIFRPAGAVVKEVLLEELNNGPCPTMLTPVNLARMANRQRQRQKMRPLKPEDLSFEIDYGHVPEGFLREDVTVAGRRELILATDAVLEELNDGPCPTLPKPVNFARMANGQMQKMRPPEPKDLTLKIEYGHVPEGFLREDVTVAGRRELILATDAVLEELNDGRCPTLPKPVNLAGMANGQMQKMCPPEPKDLTFEIDYGHVPEGFMREDVTVEGRRHLILATDAMLELLVAAKRWYVDTTFKVVKAPFTQLWSIHAFAKQDGDTNQVPLVFCLMSGKHKKDYCAVLCAVLNCLPGQPAVQEMVLDFEMSVWRAMAIVLPTVKLMGCTFHWTQSIWRKEHIPAAFAKLEEKARRNVALVELTAYVSDTWINNDVWAPSAWSVFMQSIRTNDDVEGWHHRLNFRARRGQVPFYLLVTLLHQEARLVANEVRLVSERKLKRHQMKKCRQVQALVFPMWEDYLAGNISPTQLLRACAHIYSPTV